MADSIFAFFGQIIVAGGGGALISLLLFRWLGTKWIENKFAERLEQLKHDQTVVVARLRVEIESMLSGALKFQEREFEVLPGVWAKLDAAFYRVNLFCRITANSQDAEDYISNYSDLELEEYLALPGNNFTEKTKREIRAAPGPERAKIAESDHFWSGFLKCHDLLDDYNKYFLSNTIFLPADLKEKLAAIADVLLRGLESMKFAAYYSDDEESYKKSKQEGYARLQDQGEPLRAEIEDLIRKRLESHMRAAKERASV